MNTIWAGVALGVAVLVAIGFFSLGWVARGSDNRRYGESRLRSMARDMAEEMTQPAYYPVQRTDQQPVVVNNFIGSAPVAPAVRAARLIELDGTP